MTGQPFFYFAFGAAVSEVAIDTLTGESRLLRVDILHDVGKSLNPAIDMGQIEGGFLQGVGWLTSEELWWDGEGTVAHPRALHLQDSRRQRLADGGECAPVRGSSQSRGNHLSVQGRR